ncbi:hypothetical protein [Lysinibacillus sp. NPDC056220]|uniref:hypothetical protein n=1 Tax=Lysinibacillus sp. NPDC056220 TaxID=3398580 RepID=UPI003BF4C93F
MLCIVEGETLELTDRIAKVADRTPKVTDRIAKVADRTLELTEVAKGWIERPK